MTPGNYEHFTQSIKDEADPMIETQGPAKQEVVISGKTTVNIREKPGMDSRWVGRGAAGDRFKWLETVEGMSVYTAEELERHLLRAGFSSVESHVKENDYIMVVIGKK